MARRIEEEDRLWREQRELAESRRRSGVNLDTAPRMRDVGHLDFGGGRLTVSRIEEIIRIEIIKRHEELGFPRDPEAIRSLIGRVRTEASILLWTQFRIHY